MNSVLSLILILLNFFCFIFSFMCLNWGSMYISFGMLEVLGMNFCLSIIMDFYSFSFCMVVCLISTVVMGYSLFYMGFLNSNRFVYLVFLFSLSMMILIFSGNFFTIMLGWDGLGVVSFALVIFYQNEISVKSGLLTIFMNRFGDGAMIFYMCIFFPFGSTIYLMGDYMYLEFYLGVFLFFLACFTKSAQFPFMSWLPAAMTAPTPVSSLVHSSTLVTAGVYLIIRFNIFLFDNFVFLVVSSVSLLTMGLGGFLAMLEKDFKKIVAFSTLSQLGLLVYILSFGEVKLCFFHLLTHAIFKSFLFMMCGIFMSLSYSSQDGRFMGIKFLGSGLFQLMMLFSCLNLSGFPLTMGFLSKDLMLESFSSGGVSFFYFFLFVLFCCFTVCYSLKLFFFVFFFMKSGSSVISSEYFYGGKIYLYFLVFFMSIWGLSMEEFLIDDDVFSLSQDYKIVDLLIFSLGGLFFYFHEHFYKFGIMVVDYFWMSKFFNFISKVFYSFGLINNFDIYYYLNFFFASFFSKMFLSDFKLFYYLKDMKNFWYLLFFLILFSLLY